MTENRVGVLGATGLTGSSLLPLLIAEGWQVSAFSRSSGAEKTLDDPAGHDGRLQWLQLGEDPEPLLDAWISIAPVWQLPEHFELIATSGAKRVIALSSTSRFTKVGSADSGEQAVVALLAEGEERLQSWADARGIEWVILRPTLIYGAGRDHNISSMLRFIRRFGFLPVLGPARGLRQPIHVADVAQACVAALTAPAAADRDYNLSGGETLSYRQMCERLFSALGRRPRLVRLPIFVLSLCRPLQRLLPTRLRWLVDMVERMNLDLVFDHSAAASDLGFRPRPFVLEENDLQDRSGRILP